MVAAAMSAAQATEIKNMVFIKFTVDQTKNRNTFCLIEKTLNVPAGQARPAGLNWLKLNETIFFNLHWLPLLNRTDPVRPHHLVVLVLHDVAVPDELARRVELRPDTRDLPRVGDYSVFKAGFPWLRRCY